MEWSRPVTPWHLVCKRGSSSCAISACLQQKTSHSHGTSGGCGTSPFWCHVAQKRATGFPNTPAASPCAKPRHGNHKEVGGHPVVSPVQSDELSVLLSAQLAEHDENAARGMLQLLQSPGSSYSSSPSPSNRGKPTKAVKAPKAKPMKAIKAPKAKPMKAAQNMKASKNKPMKAPKAKATKAMKAPKAKPMKTMKASNAKPVKSRKAMKAGKPMKAMKATKPMKSIKKRPAKQLKTTRHCVYSRVYHSVYKHGVFGATKEEAWLLQLPSLGHIRLDPQVSSPKLLDALSVMYPNNLTKIDLLPGSCSCAAGGAQALR